MDEGFSTQDKAMNTRNEMTVTRVYHSDLQGTELCLSAPAIKGTPPKNNSVLVFFRVVF